MSDKKENLNEEEIKENVENKEDFESKGKENDSKNEEKNVNKEEQNDEKKDDINKEENTNRRKEENFFKKVYNSIIKISYKNNRIASPFLQILYNDILYHLFIVYVIICKKNTSVTIV